MTRVHQTLAVAGALLLAPTLASAQSIFGRVLEHETDEPLGGVDIFLLDEGDRRVAITFSDSTGAFSIDAPEPGSWRLSAQLLGYAASTSAPIAVAAEERVRVQVRMAVDPVALEEPIRVVAERYRHPELQRFWDRVERGEATGQGHYIYGDKLGYPGLHVTDVLRSVPGVTVTPLNNGLGQIVRMRGGCIPAIYVDGSHVNRFQDDTIDLYVTATDIEGIEVYRGAESVGRFHDRAGCGLVLIWTQRGETSDEPLSWTRLAAAAAILVGILLVR